MKIDVYKDNIISYLGDCIEVMKLIPDNSVDMVLCDTPYGSTKCRWDSLINLDDMWTELKRICKQTTPILLFAQTPYDKVLGCSNIKQLRYEYIWEKTQATGHLNAKKMPMKAHENILVFYDKLPLYRPIKSQGHERKVSTAHHKRNTSTGEIYGKCDNFSDYDSTERYPRSVLKFPSDKQKLNLHSTQKPIALLEHLIQMYTNENDVVLDFTAGSMSTGVACRNLNRKAIMIENDEEIYNVGVNRIHSNIG